MKAIQTDLLIRTADSYKVVRVYTVPSATASATEEGWQGIQRLIQRLKACVNTNLQLWPVKQ